MSDVTVLLFGRAREIAGSAEVRVGAPPGATTATIIELLVELHPDLAGWRPFLRIAVNGEYAAEGSAVAPGDEVAVIPPVSGG